MAYTSKTFFKREMYGNTSLTNTTSSSISNSIKNIIRYVILTAITLASTKFFTSVRLFTCQLLFWNPVILQMSNESIIILMTLTIWQTTTWQHVTCGLSGDCVFLPLNYHPNFTHNNRLKWPWLTVLLLLVIVRLYLM